MRMRFENQLKRLFTNSRNSSANGRETATHAAQHLNRYIRCCRCLLFPMRIRWVWFMCGHFPCRMSTDLTVSWKSLSLSQRISARVFQCTCFVQQVAFWRGNHRKPRQRANQLWFQPYFSFTVCHTFTLWFFVRKSLFASTRKRHHHSFHFSASLFRSVRSVYGDFHAMRNSKQS